MAPRVSLVVPAFNEPLDVLAQSLGSIRQQTFADFECLVVDESSDAALAQGCRALCSEDPRFRYIRPAQRLGLAGSLNLGLQEAKGELVARFDSDDVCLPERLALQVSFLDAHPEVGVLGGALEVVSEQGQTLAFRDYPQDHTTIERRMQFTNAIAHPTVMLRRSVLLAHGGYGPEFRSAEDLELWLRLLNRGVRFANLGAVLVRYRQDSTVRNRQNWVFNRRARMRNLHLRHLPLRLAGIAAVTVWAWLPQWVQERAFKSLLLRDGR